MRHYGVRYSVLVLTAVLPSCDILGPWACTTEARAGIVVEVSDSLTGAPAAAGAVGVAQDGIFVESLTGFDDFRLSGAYERPGQYTVSITKAGYQVWTVSGVRVTDGQCHVRSVILQARLVAL